MFLFLLFYSVLVPVLWLSLLFFGIGPRRAWRLAKELYIENFLGKEIDETRLSKIETFLLFLLGPVMLYLFVANSIAAICALLYQ